MEKNLKDFVKIILSKEMENSLQSMEIKFKAYGGIMS